MSHDAVKSYWDSVPFKCIYLFHMPLFMLISGYFASHSIDSKGFSVLSKYSKRLLIPILTLCIWNSSTLIFLTDSSLKEIPAMFFVTVSCAGWFLCAVFICTCFLWAHICTKTAAAKVFSSVLPILLFLLFQTNPSISKYSAVANQITYLWPFFLLGHWLKRHHFDSEKIPKWWLGFVPITLTIAFFCDQSIFVYNTPLNWTWEGLKIDLLRTAAALCGSMAFCACVQFGQRVLNCAFIRRLGQATLAIYILHCTFLCYIYESIQKVYRINDAASAFVIASIITVVTFGFYYISRKISLLRFLLYGENFH